MSKYNIFARQLDTAFKSARTEILEARGKLQRAAADLETARRPNPRISEYDRKIKLKEAELERDKAEQAMKNTFKTALDTFNQTRRQIADNLADAVRADEVAKPEEIDAPALELLKSGVMTFDDFAQFARRFSGNRTMQRILTKYIEAAAQQADNQDRARMNVLLQDCKADAPGAALDAWGSLSELADRCTGQYGSGERNIDHVAAMSTQWEDLADAALESF